MKRLLVITLTLSFIVIIMTGCGSRETTQSESKIEDNKLETIEVYSKTEINEATDLRIKEDTKEEGIEKQEKSRGNIEELSDEDKAKQEELRGNINNLSDENKLKLEELKSKRDSK